MKSAYEAAKRVFDLASSGLMLLVGAPLWLLIAALIKLDSPGPVLFVQPALGKDGRVFSLFKFRTMQLGSNGVDHQQAVVENMKQKKPTVFDREGRPIYKTSLSDDRRITRVGRYLRRLSFDEFPQFWNVLRGEMSLVGPRPALSYEAGLYNNDQKKRFQVQPGMTGLYQVISRNRVPIEEMIRIDLEYIRRRSFWLDLLIMLKTPIAMLKGM